MIISKVLRTNLIGITARTAQALTFESSPRYLVEKSKDFSTFFCKTSSLVLLIFGIVCYIVVFVLYLCR